MKTHLWRMLSFTSLAALATLLLFSPAIARESATVKIPLQAELYAGQPQPLTPTQCGQCHESHFNKLKDAGGKHRFACQACHQSFHAYNPAKGIESYLALMPRCESCHKLPHGKAITDCASCHNDPHAIKQPVMGQRLAGSCGECHAKPQAELRDNPSKHTRLTCDACHTSHGFKPSCSMCHQPHYPAQGFDSCTGCHPVHKPTLVTYGSDTSNVACAPCHLDVVDTLRNSPSRHSGVSCATCHQNRHKAVPLCTECHQEPHPQVFLERYPSCLACHLDPHDPPLKSTR